jgi:hypothetical protein
LHGLAFVARMKEDGVRDLLRGRFDVNNLYSIRVPVMALGLKLLLRVSPIPITTSSLMHKIEKGEL